MKIAVITSGDPKNKKGAFNATHQRIKYLSKKGFAIDVFIIRYYENLLIQILRKKKYQKMIKEPYFIYDEVKYINVWFPFTLTDYLQWQKFNQLGSQFIKFAKKTTINLANYDLISAHSFEPGMIAFFASIKYNIPFAITWHGSEIHSMPNVNNAVKKMVIEICHKASLVFFVSKQLRLDAKALGIHVSSHVLYNGVNNKDFYAYSPQRRAEIKRSIKIDGVYNIAFIGGIVGVKNAQIVPEIFKNIRDSIENVKFYFVGDGNHRLAVSKMCSDLNLNAVFMGNRAPEEMPDLINCFDLVVLPSINEGLPLIVLECLSCEVPIICSRVGGIPEVLNDNFTVLPGPGFAERFAQLSIMQLRSRGKTPDLSPEFSWEKTSVKEVGLYQELLKKKSYQN